MEIRGRPCLIDDPNASSGERLLQYGQGENCFRALGEAASVIQEEVKLLETHLNSAVVQNTDEGDRGSNDSRQHF